MICRKCGALYAPNEFHTEGFDPEKCADCQLTVLTNNDLEDEYGCDSFPEFELGGEA